MVLLTTLAISGSVFGGACAIVASNKNRDVFGWFVLGFLFNLIALIVIAAISRLDMTPMEAAENRTLEAANKRDPESLRKKAADVAAALQRSRAELNR